MKKGNYWNRLVAYLYRRQTKVHTWSYKEELRAYIKKRKKRKKRLLGIMILIVICYFGNCGRDEVQIALDPYRYLFKDDWEIFETHLDDENKEISIYFKDVYSDEGEHVRDTYDAIVKIFYDEGLGKWKDYTINLKFKSYRSSPETLQIINDNSLQSLAVISSSYTSAYILSIKEIAECFPETKSLSVDEIDEYSDLRGFDNLKYFEVDEIDEEEREYVWSLFPECVIKAWREEVLYYNPELEE